MNRFGFSPDSCVACGGSELHDILSLGAQSPVNTLAPAVHAPEEFPLGVQACFSCGHGQQKYFVSPEFLFDDYFYESSVSQTLENYSKNFVNALFHEFGLGSHVIELASNDGILLKYLAQSGLRCIGVDPSLRMVEKARALGLDVLHGYWPNCGSELGSNAFDVVVAQNVLAHNPDPESFLKEAKRILRHNGLIIVQTSQADMTVRGEFDTCYHEHFSFFCEDSLRAVSHRAGLEVSGVNYTGIHGTSALFVLSQSPAARPRAMRLTRLFEQLLPPADSREENAARVSRNQLDWASFASAAMQIIAEFKEEVESFREAGYRVVAVGASAKGITALKAAGIEPDILLDEASSKIGMYVGHWGAPIRSLSDFKATTEDIYLLTAWNFAPELARKLLNQGASSKSIGISMFPKVKTVALEDFLH